MSDPNRSYRFSMSYEEREGTVGTTETGGSLLARLVYMAPSVPWNSSSVLLATTGERCQLQPQRSPGENVGYCLAARSGPHPIWIPSPGDSACRDTTTVSVLTLPATCQPGGSTHICDLQLLPVVHILHHRDALAHPVVLLRVGDQKQTLCQEQESRLAAE